MSQKHTGFNAWLGEEIKPGDEGFRLFLGRYIDRAPVANRNISLEGELVKYTGKNRQFKLSTPLDFLALLSSHIANHYESVIRLYGWYSYRSRGERRKAAAAAGRETSAEDSVEKQVPIVDTAVDRQAAKRSWAALIRKVFELEPLCCQRCGGPMKIVGFIVDCQEVSRLLKNLGIPPFTTPKPIPSTGPPVSEPRPFCPSAA